MILRFYRKSHFQHLPQNVGYLNALTVTFALDPPLQIGRNVDVQRFLLRHNTVTNPAVYKIDIHAHRPWLVVMQPLASECAESLYVIYIRIYIRPMGIPVPPRPAGRAKLRSGAGGPSREILGSQDG